MLKHHLIRHRHLILMLDTQFYQKRQRQQQRIRRQHQSEQRIDQLRENNAANMRNRRRNQSVEMVEIDVVRREIG